MKIIEFSVSIWFVVILVTSTLCSPKQKMAVTPPTYVVT